MPICKRLLQFDERCRSVVALQRWGVHCCSMPRFKTASMIACAAVAFGGTIPLSAMAQSDPVLEDQIATADRSIDPTALSLASKIVDLGYPEDTREALFFATMDQTVEQMRSAIRPTLPFDDPVAISILNEWIVEYTAESKAVLRKHIPAIMTGMTEAYATIFTVEELTDILAFVETPSGQRYFELSPAVIGSKSFADANQKYMDESMAMLGPAQRELFDRIRTHMEGRDAEETPPDA